MAMRLADTFLVYLRSCFAIIFTGQTPHWSLPRFFWDNTASLQAYRTKCVSALGASAQVDAPFSAV